MRGPTLAICALVFWACASKPTAPTAGAARDGGTTTTPTTDGGVAAAPDAGAPSFAEFPELPIVVGSAPANAPDLFAVEGPSGGGPCLAEPEAGSLFPRNWLRPRFRWTAPDGDNLFELRLIVDNQPRPLLVYTTELHYTLPQTIWLMLTQQSADQPIYFSVRSAQWDGANLVGEPRLGTSDSFTIAPVIATGQIVYWTTTNGTALKGFAVGDEDVREVLRPAQAGTRSRCVGCHASTPDGRYAAFSASRAADDGNPSRIRHRSVDGNAAEPSYVTASATAMLEREPQQQPFFSRAIWGESRRVVFSMLPVRDRWEVVWTNLLADSDAEGTGWGVIAREGDPRAAASASMRNDGNALAYVSATLVGAGVVLPEGGGDIYTVPYADGRGGPATPLEGASDPSFSEYYPAYSPDDRLLAFNRVPLTETSYNNANAEIFVVPSAGGTPVRLRANDPTTCEDRTSPGVTNSWPKWSPSVSGAGARSYYWLTFSSTRAGAKPQIFVAPLVVEDDNITTHPALPLWNQPSEEANHTAAWDAFKIR